MKILALVLRIIFGLHFLLNGLNFFFHVVNIKGPNNPIATELMGGFVQSGLFDVAKVTEITVGILLLTNRFVPLALVLAVPVASIIAFVDITLVRTLVGGWILGGGTILLNAALLVCYLKYYKPMLAFRTTPGLD